MTRRATRPASAMGKRVWITSVDEREALPLRCTERTEVNGL